MENIVVHLQLVLQHHRDTHLVTANENFQEFWHILICFWLQVIRPVHLQKREQSCSGACEHCNFLASLQAAKQEHTLVLWLYPQEWTSYLLYLHRHIMTIGISLLLHFSLAIAVKMFTSKQICSGCNSGGTATRRDKDLNDMGELWGDGGEIKAGVYAFTTSSIMDFMKKNGISLQTVLEYALKANGHADRIVWTIKKLFAKTVLNGDINWVREFPQVVFDYRRSKCDEAHSVHQNMYGFTANLGEFEVDPIFKNLMNERYGLLERITVNPSNANRSMAQDLHMKLYIDPW